jgi:peptidoglycan hydrolase CwlO-like protein
LNAKLKERDGSINRLMATLKEKDSEIGKLKESVAQWKKKYEFLSTEAPSAYQ